MSYKMSNTKYFINLVHINLYLIVNLNLKLFLKLQSLKTIKLNKEINKGLIDFVKP